MKRIVTLLVVLFCTARLLAQTAGGGFIEKEYHLFDFTFNASRLEGGVTAGLVGSFTDRTRFGMGGYVLYNGFYIDFLNAEPQHKFHAYETDERWNDNAAFSIHAGYQIPVVKWLRIMPIIGYTQTNEGITDGTTVNMGTGDETASWYHDYTVTPGSRLHYFNYGGGLSIQPCKWFSINLIASRYAIYGGIGLDVMSFINKR